MRAVTTSRQARKFLDLIPTEHTQRILETLESLRIIPWPPGVKKVLGRDVVYRIRVGSYRILYAVDKEMITVQRIDKRSRAYER